MIWEHSRFEIWNKTQHPYKHDLADFAYTNEALPGVTNVDAALNYMTAVLYPNAKDAVATPAALPVGGNTLNDYRVVTDDGDGKAAGYRWEQREGDIAAKWYKIYDMDWGEATVVSKFLNATQGQYVYSQGIDDLDDTGAVVAGLYAGQFVYGGQSASTNLTLNSNSGDGVGVQTGFVQIDSPFRPTIDNTFDLSTATERWKDGYFASTVVVGTLTIGAASITDSSGTISFGNENLTTTGNITGAIVTGSSLVADDTVNTMTLVPGSITDTTGAVTFGAANLSTSGTLGAGVTTLTDNAQTLVFDPDVAGKGSITSSNGTITFGDENLDTTGIITAGSLSAGLLDVDNLRLDLNTISSTDVNGNINLSPNGSGVVNITKSITALDAVFTGVVTVTGQLNVDNMRFDGTTFSTIAGNMILDPFGTEIQFHANLMPQANTYDIGQGATGINDIYIEGGIRTGVSDEMAINTLITLDSVKWRNIGHTINVQDGDALFYDSASGRWLASAPDTEINHSALGGLVTGDAGHTQFALLAGRAGGQVLVGGTGVSENLVLESTANATKGAILVRNNFTPETTAAFAAGWTGVDLGDSTHYFNDLYTKGELKGARLENFTSGTLPSASVQNIGRVVYATDNKKAYVDIGTAFQVLGVSKFVSDTSWNGADTVKNVDVSANITDARNAVWQLLDNANNFETMYVQIEKTTVSNVRITVSVPLAAGSYRLIGIE